MKWKSASGVLCDRRMLLKLKGKFYRTAIRSAMLYGTECWAVKHQHIHKMGAAEMRMLRWSCRAIRYALQFCITDGIDNIIIEMDTKNVCQMINKAVDADANLEGILHGIWSALNSLGSAKVAYGHRESNRVAHAVASYVFRNGGSHYWGSHWS
ncbi:hypothetical protein DVH24_001408 [Malus domestica]|uniref:RNase H type-1 domain-containing protein n=1 Tax=Malus domestica TaxID=3750 RepID=A0A498K4H1_MALDO|nr:hypothetical protein DVH24_001408 [Malus domestica]